MIPDSYIPPLRFNQVQPNLYRGAYPREPNFAFLETLQIRTIIALTPNPITMETDPIYYQFCKSNNINIVHFEVGKSGKGKKRGVPLDYELALMALPYLIHYQYQSVYIHCLNGGQVTSLLVACLRKLQLWSAISIFNEFINFTTNITVNDRNFVESFTGEIEVDEEDKVDWLWVGVSKHIIKNHPKLHIIDKKPI
ncbi:unnamed protein product [Candida verbasci]|uniref:Uncharacterized protein n=1 Tax=Candida verbasci TaxID=1227364 RepID=A0A9W4TRV7_9ASCO|nr:unnamed protein product [Candida verbasci]